jgi:hypothetical protein
MQEYDSLEKTLFGRAEKNSEGIGKYKILEISDLKCH